MPGAALTSGSPKFGKLWLVGTTKKVIRDWPRPKLLVVIRPSGVGDADTLELTILHKAGPSGKWNPRGSSQRAWKCEAPSPWFSPSPGPQNVLSPTPPG
ncbi:hypothetical protein ACCO45_003594 [Purpureocillium lilacinum]|uniref:Uncharacterized protein n=1 Tax=Purpureocillium lilacinum TaxID=33203 RepID=A0ACC4E0A0_PURLI